MKTKEGGVMDIQKEKEAFDGWLKTHPDYWDITEYEANIMFDTWQAAKAQAVPEGFVVVPREPSEKMYSEFSRHLCRYMQMHDRYCPKSLSKYIRRFIGFKNIPEWLSKEIPDWESDHAFSTADLGVFIYKSMIETGEKK